MPQCIVCRSPCQFSTDQTTDTLIFMCDRCGTYGVTHEAHVSIGGADRLDNWWAVSARLRAASDVKQNGTLTSDQSSLIHTATAGQTVSQRLRALLRLIERRATRLDAKVPVDLWSDCALVPAVDQNEMIALLNHLAAQKLLNYKQRPTMEVADVVLTMDGWEHLQRTPGQSDTVFVAMSFKAEMDTAFDAIKGAVEEDCKLTQYAPRLRAHRVDKEDFTHEITDEIITGLHRCWAVVADVTLASSGVYFEAGYGMALGRPIVFTVRADRFDKDVHFDTQQFPHIVWSDQADLRDRLAKRLSALLVKPIAAGASQ